MLNATVSHELRSPLSSIQSNIEAYERETNVIIQNKEKLKKILDRLIEGTNSYSTQSVQSDILNIKKIVFKFDHSIGVIAAFKINMLASCKMLSYFV